MAFLAPLAIGALGKLGLGTVGTAIGSAAINGILGSNSDGSQAEGSPLQGVMSGVMNKDKQAQAIPVPAPGVSPLDQSIGALKNQALGGMFGDAPAPEAPKVDPAEEQDRLRKFEESNRAPVASVPSAPHTQLQGDPADRVYGPGWRQGKTQQEIQAMLANIR